MSDTAYPPRWAYRTILMFHLLFKVIGFSTISLHDSNPKKKRPLSFAKSKFGIFYNLLFCCLLLGLSFVFLSRLYLWNYVNKTTITITIEIIQSAYGVLLMCTILLWYAFKWSVLKRVCNYLVHVEGQFRFLQEKISLERTFRVLLMVHVIQTIMFFVILVSEEVAFENGPKGWLLDSAPAAFSATIFLQYFSAISLMNLNFTRANLAFENLCRTTDLEGCAKSLNRSRRVFVDCTLIQSLRFLMDIYNDLYDVCTEISQFYSIPTLIVVPYTIYLLLFNTYYLLQPLFDSDMDFDLLTFLNTIAMIIYLVYPLRMLTTMVTNILDEVGRTRMIVHSLLKNAIDREVQSELKQFSLELLHRQIRFTSGEYFDLDNSLLQSMVSAVVTYLVILIQFLVGSKSSHVCNCNCTGP